MNIRQKLDENKIIPNLQKDQFFLLDEKAIATIVAQAAVGKDDTVLEIGAGVGNLTRELAKHAGRVVAFEVDKRFTPFLNDLPSNVDLHFEDAWNYIQLHGKQKKTKEFNKIVANLPYSFTEKLLHNLTFLDYDKAVLLVPLKSVKMINSNPVFGSFFNSKLIQIIEKEKFYPIPRTNSAIIDLIKLPDPLVTKNLSLYLRQYMYQHEDQTVKNSLREGLITYYKMIEARVITKNQAREIIKQKGISTALLDKAPDNAAVYEAVRDRFSG